MLSVVGKLYDGVLIKRVRARAECALGEEQCGFRHGRGGINLNRGRGILFAVRQASEMYLANGKYVFCHLWIWKCIE